MNSTIVESKEAVCDRVHTIDERMVVLPAPPQQGNPSIADHPQ